MSRLLLKVVNATIGGLTIVLATMSLVFGAESPVYGDANIPELPVLDSNLRFFGGMGLGLGVVLLWLTPAIERQTVLFRAVWLCAFLGGLGRVVSMMLVGLPAIPMVVFTIIEIPLVPVLIYWQSRVSKASRVEP